MPDNQTLDTPTRAEISRANGAKSRGPTTPEGKAISARNGIRHGLRARQIVLPDESAPTYRALLRSYMKDFSPRNTTERDLVTVLAVSRWRLRRLLSIETNLLAHEIESQSDIVDRYVENCNKEKRMAWVFDRISGGASLSLLARYEGSLHRAFNGALKQLQSLRIEPRLDARQKDDLKSPKTTRTQDSDPASLT